MKGLTTCTPFAIQVTTKWLHIFAVYFYYNIKNTTYFLVLLAHNWCAHKITIRLCTHALTCNWGNLSWVEVILLFLQWINGRWRIVDLLSMNTQTTKVYNRSKVTPQAHWTVLNSLLTVCFSHASVIDNTESHVRNHMTNILFCLKLVKTDLQYLRNA